MAAAPLLSLHGLSRYFGGVKAVEKIDLEVHDHQIVALIGPNGAGKTTAFNVITRIFPATEGHVKLRFIEPGRDYARAHRMLRIIAGVVLLGFLVELLLFARNDPTGFGWVGMGIVSLVVLVPVLTLFRAAWAQKVLAIIVVLHLVAAAGTLSLFIVELLFAASVEVDALELVRNIVFTGVDSAVLYFLLSTAVGDVLAVGGKIDTLVRDGVSDITHWETDRICSAGIARTYQNIRLFAELPALHNVKMGLHTHTSGGLFGALARIPIKVEETEAEVAAWKYLEFVGLQDRAHEVASNLAYGDQRRLEIARALACQPQLLLLDEPAAGMNPQETEDLMALIRKIRDAGVTILLIEHDMKLVMAISDIVYVLDHGEMIAHGTPEEVSRNPKVIEAYLGAAEDE